MKQVFIALFILTSTLSFAQSSSPYSRFGLGELVRPEQTHLRAMGYLSTAYRDQDSVYTNLSNPATLGSRKNSSFDVGMTVDFHSLTDSRLSNSVVNAGLTHFAYSFPVTKSKNWGVALGLAPFSSKDYDVTTPLENNSFFRDFEGEGNTQRLFLQNGVSLTENFSLGLDAGLFFGKLEDVSLNTFLSTLDNSTGVETQRTFRGANFKFGGQFTDEIKENLHLTIGATYQLEMDVNEEITTNNFLYRSSQIEQVSDDIFNLINYAPFDEQETITDSEVTLPTMIGIGGFLSKTNKWSLGADMKMGMWEDFQNANDGSTFRNSLDLSAGGSFIPNFRGNKTYERLEYRYGLHYSQTYLVVRDTEINDFGLTLGTSIPIRRRGQRGEIIKSSIDFAIDLGQTGTLDNDLVRDSYVKTSIGLNLNDQWFQRKRYD